jgi:hypothetical protein
MPTFEKCQACVSKGVPADEAPIVLEGKACQSCERETDHVFECFECKAPVPAGKTYCAACFNLADGPK